MTTPKLFNRKATKIRFFALYTISILLVLVLFASFTQGRISDVGKTILPASSAITARTAVDELLHQQMEKLEDARARYAGKDTSRAATDAIQAEKASFFAVVDSIRKATASLSDAEEKQQIEALLTTFSRSAESGVVVLKNAAAAHDIATGKAGPTQEEMDELKEILAQKEQKIMDLERATRGAQGAQNVIQEKDKTIATLQNKITSLETALAQQPKQLQPRNDAGAAEWQAKYNKMKEANDQLRSINQKYESQANALKTSYKEVIDDNKRLASQIQALKAGKN